MREEYPMKKRFLALLLALVMVLGMLPAAALAVDSEFTIYRQIKN